MKRKFRGQAVLCVILIGFCSAKKELKTDVYLSDLTPLNWNWAYPFPNTWPETTGQDS